MPRRFSILIVIAVFLLAPVLAGAQEETLLDPTRPFSAKSVATSSSTSTTSTTGTRIGVTEFRVTAIVTSDRRRIAVVNGQRVAEGDQVDGATVVEILADALRLKYQGNAITTRVLPNGFRK